MQDSTHQRGEFFCGDGIVQTKDNTDKGVCTDFGLTCKLVTGGGSGQYPGIGYSGGTDISEQCDYNDSQISDSVAADTKRQRLCKRAFGNRTYYPDGSPTCNNSCQISATKGTDCQWCGDGTKNGSEGCDNGPNNSNAYSETGNCKTDCSGLGPRCGDGIKNGTEDCDSDRKSSYTCPYGTATCTYCNMSCKTTNATGPYCGDGTVNGTESCDKGSNNTNTAPSCSYGSTCSYCTTSCVSKSVRGPYCGDGVVNGSESCDGGSTSCSDLGYKKGTATCNSSCQWDTGDCSNSGC